MVEKTVSINGSKEQKKLKVDWDREFGEFIEADINKASWSGMFAFSASDTSETYISQSDKIPVKQLEIKKNGNRIRSIKLIIINDNDLYRSHDTLSYYPDTLYHIIKSQKIKLMEQKRFEVVGRF
ncbi:MAG: hypothetical protein REI78_12360 [Pedobacter sp.]|nr:hypothetical protein [Pedobacter sp.]